MVVVSFGFLATAREFVGAERTVAQVYLAGRQSTAPTNSRTFSLKESTDELEPNRETQVFTPKSPFFLTSINYFLLSTDLVFLWERTSACGFKFGSGSVLMLFRFCSDC
jgi:hypothetical protein